MPRDDAIIFGDVIGKPDLLRIECAGRSGRDGDRLRPALREPPRAAGVLGQRSQQKTPAWVLWPKLEASRPGCCAAQVEASGHRCVTTRRGPTCTSSVGADGAETAAVNSRLA
jgi:hypothetical protein